MRRAAAGLPASPDLPAVEREVARWWRERSVPERCAARGAGGPRWTCYAAPAVAAGVPGLHHVADRVLADVPARFMAMRGYDVVRAGGWDCHGLPAEVAVERELGLSGPAEIEAYGTGAFVARCREYAARHAVAQARLAERAGCAAGLTGARSTMEPAYVESVWWSLRVLFDRGLLVSDLGVSPCCPRCATPLSDREAGRPEARRAVREPVVTVRFPLRGPLPDVLRGASLLAVPPAPWTLAACVALLAAPDVTYAVARRSGQGDRVVVADAVLGRVLGEGWHVVRRLPGAELAGLAYDPPLPLSAVPGPHRVIAASLPRVPGGWDGWTSEDCRGPGSGTGLACVAPAFGAADLALARAHGLPVADLVGADGTFSAGLPLVGGLAVAVAGQRLVSGLADRGLLHASAWREHARPHCWRCAAPLLPRAVRAWRIPGENGSWTVSRTRCWGTPVPVWTCPAGHATCAGSLAELSALAGRELSGLDPHRPHVDKIIIGCPRCGAPARRVPEVLDAAYDAAALPFAFLGAPDLAAGRASAHAPEPAPAAGPPGSVPAHSARLAPAAPVRAGCPARDPGEPGHARQPTGAAAAGYPADLACASGDPGAGWLDTLRLLGTLVLGQPPYLRAARRGPVPDDQGRPVSAQLGNVQEPLAVLDSHGADAVRWLFAAGGDGAGPPGAALDEITQRVVSGYWAAARAALSARTDSDGAGSGRPALDRWLLSELNVAVREVTAALEAADTAAACRLLGAFIDDLAECYLPRFGQQKPRPGPGGGRASGVAPLRECVATLTRLMAPFMPFITEYVWEALGLSPDSVHLASWPACEASLIDPRLAGQLAQARRLADLGRAARAAAGLPGSQPLPRALASAAAVTRLPADLRADVLTELNVAILEPAADLPPPGPAWAVAADAAVAIALELPPDRAGALRPADGPGRQAAPAPAGRPAPGSRPAPDADRLPDVR